MARRTAQVRITDDNRDRGKVYFLTEMDAEQAEEWGARALLALANAGAEIPDDFEGSGMAGIAAMGVQAMQGLAWDVVKPLWTQMFTCVQIMPDPSKGSDFARDLAPGDIEEIATRLRLRKEIVELHVNFSRNGNPSTSALSPEVRPLADGMIMRTSHATSR